jgi:hypothetical protein
MLGRSRDAEVGAGEVSRAYMYSLQRGVIGVLMGLTRTLSRVIWTAVSVSPSLLWHKGCRQPWRATYLFEGLCIDQHPAQLDDFGRVLCDVDTMLVAGGSDVNHDIAIEGGLRALLRTGHADR